MVDKDTIVAIATPPGKGGIGIVRVSGKETKGIMCQLVSSELTPRFAHFCSFNDEQGNVIDRGLAIYFPAPASYTGEDVLELHGHGGQAVLSLLVGRVVELGARQARPGEFTERAFLNNKIDLLQAEAVADLIESSSAHAARSAIRSLEGAFSKNITKLLDELISIRKFVECALDFSDEDTGGFDPSEIHAKLEASIEKITETLTKAKYGVMLQEGYHITIIGKPNVGKSSLFNLLVGRDAAIVTEIPGTTRDIVSDRMMFEGIHLQIVDTAGIRHTKDIVELEGIRRAKTAAENTDIVLLITEADRNLDVEEKKLLKEFSCSANTILVRNKIDLAGEKAGVENTDNRETIVLLSAKTGEGVELLLQQLRKILDESETREDVFIARERHVHALEETLEHMHNRLSCCDIAKAELLAEELRLAQETLGKITGIYSTEDLLGEIFSDFCIGK